MAAFSLVVLSAFLPSAPGLTITQTKLGNVFYTTETVSFQLSGGDGSTVQWTATDYFGAVAGQGSVTLSGGSAALSFNLSRRGYFDLQLVEKNGSTTVATKFASFAVLTPIDVSTMADSPFGVQTHFAQSHLTEQLPLLARAGIAHHRDEQYWNQIETQPQVYSFPSKFANYMAASAAEGLQPLITLDWSNRFYDFQNGQFTAPHTDSGRLGYANYALALLNRYGSQIKAFEIWNEYNAGTFIRGPATADKDLYYYLMLKKTAEEVKAVRPDVTMVAGGTVPVAHGFLRDVFAQGAMPYVDAVSVHPYRSVPEGVDLEISELRNLIKSYNSGQEKPIWASEFGMSVSNVAGQYSAASYLARIATLMLSEKVARMYFYLNQDDGSFPYRGLLSSAGGTLGKYAPHPSYVAYANVIRQLYGWTPAGRLGGTATTTYVYKFKKDSREKYVMWSTAPTVVGALSFGNPVGFDLMGGEIELKPTLPGPDLSWLTSKAMSAGAGHRPESMGPEGYLPARPDPSPADRNAASLGLVTAELSEDPIYIDGPLFGITEAPNPVIADSISGYSKTQGENGWYYGYADLSSSDPYMASDFQAMTWGIWKTDNYRWLGTSDFHFHGINNAHPASGWAIRRWISDTFGVVTLSGSVARSSSAGDGVGFRVFVDGKEVFNQHIPPAGSLKFEIPELTIRPGTNVDLAITQQGNNASDSTGLTARITRTSRLRR